MHANFLTSTLQKVEYQYIQHVEDGNH